MENSLHTLLINALSPNEVATILKSLEPLSPSAQKEATDAGLILSDFSMKSAIEYFRVVHQVLKWIDPAELSAWVGMGIVISQAVSAGGIRYFREGPALLSKIADRTVRDKFLALGISLARQNPNLAMEYYRQAPVFLTEVTADSNALSEWAEYGFTLGDHTLTVEYFRTTPALLRTLSIAMLPYWVGIAKTLAVAKLYDAITFMRTSPDIFRAIGTNALPLLTFLGALADDSSAFQSCSGPVPRGTCSGATAMTCFNQSSEIVPRIPPALREPFFSHLLDITQFDLAEGKALFLNAPKILKETGQDSFLPFIAYGIELLKKGNVPCGSNAKGYFALESKAAKEKANQLMGGAFLFTYEKVLQLFAEALCGRPVRIKQGADQNPTTDGKTIYLPPHIRIFEDDAQNFEWYKIATAFQAGYLEFGTFDPSLASFLGRFPKPTLIKQIFDIAEGARVEFLLKKEYPGLVAGFIKMREGELSRRPPTTSSSPRECVVEWLCQISLAGKTKEPVAPELSKIFFDACLLLGAVQSTEATVVHSMKAATAVYTLLDEQTPIPSADHEMELLEQKGEKIYGTGVKSGNIAPLQSALPTQSTVSSQGEAPAEATPSIRGSINPQLVEEASPHPTPLPQGEREKDSKTKNEEDKSARSKTSFIYDEWDCEADDYRTGFCHIMEKEMASEGKGAAFAEGVIAEYGGMIKSIKRGFQFLAPEEMVWIKGEVEGDQFDFNRLVENRSEASASVHPSDRIYMRRQKKERSVSALFLLDISGSTEQRVGSGKSILQIEKEALILLANAIEAAGDRFALYGFSGRGNHSVLFYTLKDFQTHYTKEIDFRVGNTASVGQNRDGAAIRHAVSKLCGETTKTKILVLISDGKPLDDQYAGSYAIADTKMALIEARRKGIHPFCITIDQGGKQGAESLKGANVACGATVTSEMYGPTAYLVIDKIESLPIKLPRIYKRLTS